MTNTPTSGAAIQPVLWVSPEQFANFMDADEAQFGRYVPARKTSAGNFTMPLFAALAPAQPVAEPANGTAYAALPDEGEMLKHALWLASSFTVHRYLMSNAEGRWSGAEKAACHDELCCLYVAVFRGVEVDQVRVGLEADWMAVHDATQELTDHMDVVIGFPLKGVPDYDALAPKFFDHFHRLATHAIRASRGQASSQAGEYPALVCDYCGALTPDPWHSSGMLHGKMSKHIHSCDACAARGAAQAQAAKQQEQLI